MMTSIFVDPALLDDTPDLSGEPEILFQPLFERPSRARSRENAIAAHERCRVATKLAVSAVIESLDADERRGKPFNRLAKEKKRKRASRLIGRSRMFGLREALQH